MYAVTESRYATVRNTPQSVTSQKSQSNTYINSVAMFGLLLLGTGTAYIAERSSTWRGYIQGRVPFVVEKAKAQSFPVQIDTRMPVVHIENIKLNLMPSVSDLATTLGITRQAVYKWSAGSAFPDEANLERLVELSHIADKIKSAEIKNISSLVKMKMFNGRSFLELIKAGNNTDEALSMLIAESQVMEKAYDSSGIKKSKSRSDNSWQSDISMPGGLS